MAASSSTESSREGFSRTLLRTIHPSRLNEELPGHLYESSVHITHSETKFTSAQLEIIGRFIPKSFSLTRLHLCNLHIEQLCPAFMDALKNTSTLKTLHIFDSSFTEKNLDLCAALASSPSLTELWICTSSLHPSCVEAISRSLATNSILEKLSFSESNIDNAGGAALALGLRRNTHLQKLDLSHNQLGDRAGAHLAYAVDYKSSIPLPKDPVQSKLLKDLSCNSSLRSLDLAGNPLTEHTAIYFAYALRTNEVLLRLDLYNPSVSQTNPAYKSIKGKLDRNSEIFKHNEDIKKIPRLLDRLLTELDVQPLIENYETLKTTYLAQQNELNTPLARAKSQKQRTRDSRNREKLMSIFEQTQKELFNALTLLVNALPDSDPRKPELQNTLDKLTFN